MKEHFTKYWIHYTIAVLLLLITIYMIKQRNPPLRKRGGDKNGVTFTADIDEQIVLMEGSQGSEVRELQRILNEKQIITTNWYYKELEPDGVFGSLTKENVEEASGKSDITLEEARAL